RPSSRRTVRSARSASPARARPAGARRTAPALSEQWDRHSDHACFMLMLPGPTKVDLVFPSEQREGAPAWEVTPDTLEAIDRHFWDWALWLEQKRRGGSVEQYEKS